MQERQNARGKINYENGCERPEAMLALRRNRDRTSHPDPHPARALLPRTPESDRVGTILVEADQAV
jgi:hypothetical protein